MKKLGWLIFAVVFWAAIPAWAQGPAPAPGFAELTGPVYRIEMDKPRSQGPEPRGHWVYDKTVAWIQLWDYNHFRIGFTDGSSAEGTDSSGSVIGLACTARATGLLVSLYVDSWDVVTDVTLH